MQFTEYRLKLLCEIHVFFYCLAFKGKTYYKKIVNQTTFSLLRTNKNNLMISDHYEDKLWNNIPSWY